MKNNLMVFVRVIPCIAQHCHNFFADKLNSRVDLVKHSDYKKPEGFTDSLGQKGVKTKWRMACQAIYVLLQKEFQFSHLC